MSLRATRAHRRKTCYSIRCRVHPVVRPDAAATKPLFLCPSHLDFAVHSDLTHVLGQDKARCCHLVPDHRVFQFCSRKVDVLRPPVWFPRPPRSSAHSENLTRKNTRPRGSKKCTSTRKGFPKTGPLQSPNVANTGPRLSRNSPGNASPKTGPSTFLRLVPRSHGAKPDI